MIARLILDIIESEFDSFSASPTALSPLDGAFNSRFSLAYLASRYWTNLIVVDIKLSSSLFDDILNTVQSQIKYTSRVYGKLV